MRFLSEHQRREPNGANPPVRTEECCGPLCAVRRAHCQARLSAIAARTSSFTRVCHPWAGAFQGRQGVIVESDRGGNLHRTRPPATPDHRLSDKQISAVEEGIPQFRRLVARVTRRRHVLAIARLFTDIAFLIEMTRRVAPQPVHTNTTIDPIEPACGTSRTIVAVTPAKRLALAMPTVPAKTSPA